MPNWDQDSSKLRDNLARALTEIVETAKQRNTPNRELARHWQIVLMDGLVAPNPRFIGAFRGEPGLEHVQVRVGDSFGVNAIEVAAELTVFEEKLQTIVAELDTL